VWLQPVTGAFGRGGTRRGGEGKEGKNCEVRRRVCLRISSALSAVFLHASLIRTKRGGKRGEKEEGVTDKIFRTWKNICGKANESVSRAKPQGSAKGGGKGKGETQLLVQ